jgi:hypothetical protein
MKRAKTEIDLGHSLAYGHELEFISIINRDGKGVEEMDIVEGSIIEQKEFKLHRLSITEGTYIAINFNAYVVRLK